MPFLRRPLFAFALGLFVIFGIALLAGNARAPALAQRLADRAPAVIDAAGGGGTITADFVSPSGLPSRHPVLHAAYGVNEATRAEVARAVAAIPGVGGVRWSDGDMIAEAGERMFRPLHCQEDVQALLRARTIRFEESSARIDAASGELIGEVAEALRPCLGAIIQITGHTDQSGLEPSNIALSDERAEAVRDALVRRGIPAHGLRARGVGSRVPVEGLDPTDPANRRIEFSVIATEPISPTPVDTPAPR